MAAKPLPTAEELRQRLRYEPETGELFWRELTAEMFTATKRTAAAKAKHWNSRRAGRPAFTKTDKGGYRIGAICGSEYRAHRIIWRLVTGDTPDTIDHINGDTQDNRWDNLRSISMVENMRNQKRRANNTSGFVGVSWDSDRGKWRATIKDRGRSRYLGLFSTKEGAAAAYSQTAGRLGYHSNHGRD